MSRSGSFSIAITAQDRASATLDRFNKRLERASAPVARLSKGFDRLSKNVGFTDTLRGFRALRRELSGAAGAMGQLGGGLGGLLGAGSIAGAAALANRYANVGSNLFLMARQARTSVPHLQRLQNAAALAGGSAEGAGQAFIGLQNNLQSAAAGHNTEAMAALNQLHVDWGGAGHALPAGRVLGPLLEKLAAVKNLTLQAKLGNMIFGGSFAAIQPMLMGGVHALHRYNAAGARMVTWTDRQTRQARVMQEATRRLTGDIETTAMVTVGKLIPAVGGGANAMARWVEANQAWVETNISGEIDRVAGAINNVVQRIGGWRAASSDLAQFWLAGFLPPLLGGLVRANMLLGALARAGGYHGIAGQTDAQRRTYLHGQDASFDNWLRAHTGLHTGLGSQLLSSAGAGAPRLPRTAAGRATMAQAAGYFRAHGWTPAQTAGILSNISAESGFNPRAVGDHGTSFGLFQLHAGRARMFSQWLRQTTGGRVTDPRNATTAQQLAFAQWELTSGDQRGAGAALRMAHSPQAAGAVFSHDFERPANGTYQAMSRGGAAYLFLPPAQSVQTHTVKGAAHVHINLAGAPPGTRVSAHTDGPLFTGAPKVTMPMPPGGAPT